MLRVLLGALLTIAVASPAVAGDTPESKETGESIYRVYCTSCHGTEGKGDGQIADALRIRPADLTLLASHNNGKFDADQVFKIIDGRKTVKGHGGADMPIWGDAFKTSHGGYDEAAVKLKIESLVEYLESIQVKKAK
jgi:mono/diheme cytochrome c family protein